MKEKKAFTLAEVVITLIVIGVVSAVTIPMLHNDVNDKKWNVARQKAQATIGEAFKLMTVNGEITTKKADGTTMTTADFVSTVIPKYLKLEKTCAPANYKDCGFSAKVKMPGGQNTAVLPDNYKWTSLSGAYTMYNRTSPSTPNSWAYAESRYPHTQYDTSYFFRTLDGFSVAFLYNPYCVSDRKQNHRGFMNISGELHYVQLSMDVTCMMGIYDMNGKSGPNQVGKDIGFVGSFYNGFETRAAAVSPHPEEKHHSQVPSVPAWNGKVDNWGALANYCNKLGKNNDWIMPDINETSLLFLNNKLIADRLSVQRAFFSRTPLPNSGNEYFYDVDMYGGSGGHRHFIERPHSNGTWGMWVRCVRNTSLR